MTTVWIDPSYTGTGICVVRGREISLGLFGNKNSKRDLGSYFYEATQLRDQLRGFLDALGEDFCVVMEAPFPGGLASPGLYGLQFLYLDLFKSMSRCKEVRSITPSWVSSCWKKNKVESNISEKKAFSKRLVSKLKSNGYRVKEEKLLDASGCDVATALMFFYMSSVQHREWKII